jgi:hypothetical protein
MADSIISHYNGTGFAFWLKNERRQKNVAVVGLG